MQFKNNLNIPSKELPQVYIESRPLKIKNIKTSFYEDNKTLHKMNRSPALFLHKINKIFRFQWKVILSKEFVQKVTNITRKRIDKHFLSTYNEIVRYSRWTKFCFNRHISHEMNWFCHHRG